MREEDIGKRIRTKEETGLAETGRKTLSVSRSGNHRTNICSACSICSRERKVTEEDI